MSKNHLLIYSEQLATDVELLCQNLKVSSNTLFQIRKSSSSIYTNIREANYGQSKSDMVSKFEIALQEFDHHSSESSYHFAKQLSSSFPLQIWLLFFKNFFFLCSFLV